MEVQKESSMIKQKQMLAEHFLELSQVRKTGRKVAYTFVPGNLAEFVTAFDMLPVYPEINSLQSGMRKKSEDYIREAEDFGYSEKAHGHRDHPYAIHQSIDSKGEPGQPRDDIESNVSDEKPHQGHH